MKISKEFSFDAAHHLPNVPEGHKCGRVHGHTYAVRLELVGPIDAHLGWVQDFGEIKDVWKRLEAEHLDHRDLNDWIENPTAELLALAIHAYLQRELPLLEAVEVRETSGTCARSERFKPEVKA